MLYTGVGKLFLKIQIVNMLGSVEIHYLSQLPNSAFAGQKQLYIIHKQMNMVVFHETLFQASLLTSTIEQVIY